MINFGTYWYVLFARTGSEEKIVQELKEKLDCEKFAPFFLGKKAIYRRKGEKTEFTQLCFPGYVFIESSEEPEDFMKCYRSVIRKVSGVFKLANYGDGAIALREEEKIALRALFGENYIIDVPRILKEGDNIKIISGNLKGHESKIVRCDKNGVTIAFELFEKPVEVTLGVEMVRTAGVGNKNV